MKFDKTELLDAIYDESDILFNVNITEIGSSRWANVYKMVFRYQDSFFQIEYRQGTGDEGERPFEHDDDKIECSEVHTRILSEDELIEFISKKTREYPESRRDAEFLPWDGNDELDIGRYRHGRAEIRSFAKYVSKNLLEEYDVTIKK